MAALEALRRRPARLAIACAVVAAVGVLFWVRHQVAGLHPVYLLPGFNATTALLRNLAGDRHGAARALRAHFRGNPAQDRQGRDESYARLLRGETEAAEQTARAAMASDPGDTRAPITLAQALLELGRAEEALAVLDAVLERDPERPINTLTLKAVIQTRLEAHDAALETWHRALRYGGPGTRALVYVAVLETAQALEDAQARPAGDALLAQFHRYLRYYDRREDRAVRRYAHRAVASGDGAADGWVALGESLGLAGERDAAIRALEEATRIAPAHAEAWHRLANARSVRGDLGGELQATLAALRAAPADGAIAEWALKALADKYGDYRRVVAEADARVAAGRLEFGVLFELGKARAFLGDVQGSLVAYSRALELRPRDPRLLGTIANVYVGSGHAAQALDFAQRASEASPAWAYPHTLRAIVFTNAYRYDEAIAAYESAFRLQVPEADQVAHLCTLYHTANRWQQGLECFENVLRRDPSNVLAGRMIGESRNNAALARQAAKVAR